MDCSNSHPLYAHEPSEQPQNLLSVVSLNEAPGSNIDGQQQINWSQFRISLEQHKLQVDQVLQAHVRFFEVLPLWSLSWISLNLILCYFLFHLTEWKGAGCTATTNIFTKGNSVEPHRIYGEGRADEKEWRDCPFTHGTTEHSAGSANCIAGQRWVDVPRWGDIRNASVAYFSGASYAGDKCVCSCFIQWIRLKKFL